MLAKIDQTDATLMTKSHLSRSKRRVGESRSSPRKRTTANVKPTTSEPIGVSGNLSPSNLLEQLKNQSPPFKSDPINQHYINRIDHNKEYCDHVVMDEKYYASDINSMKSKTPPMELLWRIKSGEVWECYLHKIAISQDKTKYEKYNAPYHVLPVKVRWGNLAGTLIPFDEPVINHRGFIPRLGVVSSEGEAELNNFRCYIHQATELDSFGMSSQVRSTIVLDTLTVCACK